MEKTKKILIVDDEVEICKAVELFLRETKAYEPLFAVTGKEGIRLAECFQPHLILLDRMLPDISGAEVAAALRENPRTTAIPVVFMTGLGDEADHRPHPHNHVLSKPFNVDNVIEKIEEVLGKSG
jgi:putative two-component system response regulator